MNRVIYAGLYTEGPTDERLLNSIVKRTLDDIAFECTVEIDTELYTIRIDKKQTPFIEQVYKASCKGVEEYGILILCVHTDADEESDKFAMSNKIVPALDKLQKEVDEDSCKIIVPLIPVYMSEAWMLADKELLKRQIGTNKSDVELGIDKKPEEIVDPKDVIKQAILKAQADNVRRLRKQLTIADLYQLIGGEIDLEKLSKLSSYRKFKENVRAAFRKLNLLHDR